jgi:mannan endo-1,4-beta-mannosidase
MEMEAEWQMVQKKGNQFVVNEQPFYVNGFNTYWLMVFAADESTRGKVTDVFKRASSVGMTVCRTWAFNDGQWRALQKSPSLYDEQVFKALDFVVSEAKKYRIRLILSLVNNWEEYGGKAQYVKWGNAAAGLNLTSDDEFFSHPTLRGYYKDHVKVSSFPCAAVLHKYLKVNNTSCFKLIYLIPILCRWCSIELTHSQISLIRKIQQYLLGN